MDWRRHLVHLSEISSVSERFLERAFLLCPRQRWREDRLGGTFLPPVVGRKIRVSKKCPPNGPSRRGPLHGQRFARSVCGE